MKKQRKENTIPEQTVEEMRQSFILFSLFIQLILRNRRWKNESGFQSKGRNINNAETLF